MRKSAGTLGTLPILLAALGALNFTPSALAAQWIHVMAGPSGASLYRSAQTTSELMGRYGPGTHLKIYDQDRAGFYAIYFSHEWKGVHYAWVPKSDLDFSASVSPPDSTRVSQNSHRNPANLEPSTEALQIVRLGASYSLVTPGDLQTILGDSALSVDGIGALAEFQFHFTRALLGLIGAHYSTLSGTLQSGINTGSTYAISGFSGHVGLGLEFLTAKIVQMSLSLTGGVSVNSVTNSNSGGNTASTSAILGFPLTVALTTDIRFHPHWGCSIEVGYLYQVISAVPVIPSDTTQVTTDITLSAPSAAVTVNYLF